MEFAEPAWQVADRLADGRLREVPGLGHLGPEISADPVANGLRWLTEAATNAANGTPSASPGVATRLGRLGTADASGGDEDAERGRTIHGPSDLSEGLQASR